MTIIWICHMQTFGGDIYIYIYYSFRYRKDLSCLGLFPLKWGQDVLMKCQNFMSLRWKHKLYNIHSIHTHIYICVCVCVGVHRVCLWDWGYNIMWVYLYKSWLLLTKVLFLFSFYFQGLTFSATSSLQSQRLTH